MHAPGDATLSSVASPNAHVRLIATDLDGTLLRADGSVSERTRTALRLARDRGLLVALVTGRPPDSVLPIARALDMTSLAICCNGALVYDPERDAVVHHLPLDGAVASELVLALRAALPDVAFACELGLSYGCEPGYLRLRPHAAARASIVDDALALCAEPVTTLVVRHPTLAAAALNEHVRAVAGVRASVTYAGNFPIDVLAAGVEKASTLAWLCARHDIPSRAVVAFGDGPNDLPMIQWAGHGVAVANAHASLLAAAQEVAPANDDDGVAQVIERLVAHLPATVGTPTRKSPST